MAVNRFANVSEEEMMRRRFGGGCAWENGFSGDAGGVFNRSCSDSKIRDISVARSLF